MPSDLQRKRFKFNCNGIDLVHPVDLIPDGYYPYLNNVRSVVQGSVECRPGYSKVNSAALNSGAPIHSIRRVNNLLPGATSPEQLFLGTGTSLYSGPSAAGPYTSIASGFSGNPLSSVIFRPDQSPESWIYFADQNKMVKASCEQVVRNVGIAPPTIAPTPDITSVGGISGVTNNGIVDDCNATTGWSAGGTAGAISNPTRVPAATTVSDLLYDTGSNGWCCASPENAAGDYAFLQPGCRLIITGSGGPETVTVTEVHDDIPNTTIAGIIYDSGTSGPCSISLSTQTPQLARNSLLLLSTTSIVRVLSVTAGPDGLSSFRCSDPHTHVAGDAVRSVVSFRMYTTISIPTTGVGVPTAATTITGLALESTIAAGTGWATKTVAEDLSIFANVNGSNRPLQPDDYMHISMRFDVPGNISSGRIMLDVSDGTFTKNYYYKEFRQSDLQSNTTGTLTSTVVLQTAIQNQIVDSSAQGGSVRNNGDAFNSIEGSQIDNNYSNVPDPSQLASSVVSTQLNTGTSQWTELYVKYADLVRVGTDQAASLQHTVGIRVELIVSAVTVMDFAAWWVGGSYGPDVQQNSPVGIQYRYRYRDSRTGAKSVPSPACRYQLYPLRQQITVGVTASSDAQVNMIDVEKFDPALANFVYAGSTPNTTGNFIDDTAASLIAANPSFETNVFQPWPVLDTPKTSVVNVAGTSVKWVSGDTFPTSLIPGTVLLIGNDAVQLYGQPASSTFLEITSNLGALTNATMSVASPTLLGQPLPIMFGPLEGPTAVYAFGIGDLRNPGTLYWTNGNDLDSASDQNTLEVTSPSEPLIAGCVWQTLVYVASAKRVFLITPSFGTNSQGAQTLNFTSTELTSISGSFSPWGMCKGAQGVYMTGRDGIYSLNYNSGTYLSQQVYPLWPHDGGAAVQANGINPIDLTAYTRMRLSYCDADLFFDYQDSSTNPSTFRIDPGAGFWPDSYNDAVILHYWEEVPEGTEPRMLMGTDDGFLLTAGGSMDAGQPLIGTIRTPSLDMGDSRTLDLFMDMMTDANAAGGYSLVVKYDNYTQQPTGFAAQAAAAGRTQYLNSLSAADADGLELFRNIAAQYTISASTILYEFEPSFYVQPFKSNFYTTQLMDHGIPGWKQLRFGRIALISSAAVTIQIMNDDAVVLDTITVPSTSGRLFNDFVQLENASKGRLLRYTASSSTEFVLFVDKTYVRIKKWGGPQFLEVRPFLQ